MAAIDVSLSGPAVTITLSRPDVRNAFNEELIEELTAWARGPLPAGARVAVLRGAGKSFCAGADLAWMARTAQYTHDENLRDAARMAAMFHALNELPLPLVGRVHGAALGGGAGLAAVCDIVVAADDAVFGFTEVKLGILPSVIAPFVLARIGAAAARELFLTGARFSAARAREIGLAHAVVAQSALDETLDAYVREIRSSAPGAIAEAKQLIQTIAGRPAREVEGLTVETIAARRVSSEGRAGIRAFLDKHPAPWTAPE